MLSCQEPTFEPLASALSDVQSVRLAIRRGQWTRHTSGLADRVAHGNVVILTADLAEDFLRFCQRNPKPCPLLAVGEPGQPTLTSLGVDIDIRTDVPRYRVWRHGELVDEPTDISHLWRSDLVTFVLGCSFSFERALLDEGLTLRHVEQRRNVAMYRTNLQTEPAGPFRGPLVVSMRPFSGSDAVRAVNISARFPAFHGAPVHLGDPAAIGIADLSRPDYGDAIDSQPGDVPVFWACGVTSQAVLEAARPSLCITHAPGSMLITDLPHQKLASV